MPDGFRNRPKILRGAFVEFGLSIPPLFVVFQFNPDQLSRNRSVYYSAPSRESRVEYARARGRSTDDEEYWVSLRDYHQRDEFSDLIELQEQQRAEVQPESISFDIRLDATDDMEEGSPIAAGFGVMPRLATLETMMQPKDEGILSSLFPTETHSFTRTANPPLVLFIWGIKRVLPVNINSISVTETHFSTLLDPIRASVSVNLTVIEGQNIPYTYSKVLREVSTALNLANITDIANVVVPG